MVLDIVHFMLRGMMIIVVSTVGLVGNILTLVVMSRPSMRSSINCLLMGMVVCDIIFLITYMLVYGFRAVLPSTGTRMLFYYQYHVYPHIVPYLYPTGKSAQTMSVYLTVAVTLERWVAVCHPLRAKSLCTYSRARWCVIGIAVLALVYGAPRYLEYEILTTEMNNETIYYTHFRESYYTFTYHLVYRHWIYTLIMYIIPFTALVVFNACIVRGVWRARAKRAEMTGVQRREIRLGTMLLVIVVVFFACNLLPLVRNTLYITGTLDGKEPLIYTSDFLLTVNHAVNCVIYAIFSENFRQAFVETFCVRRRMRSHVNQPTSPAGSNNSLDTVSTSPAEHCVVSNVFQIQIQIQIIYLQNMSS